jgi:hypothetical protein
LDFVPLPVLTIKLNPIFRKERQPLSSAKKIRDTVSCTQQENPFLSSGKTKHNVEFNFVVNVGTWTNFKQSAIPNTI